MLNKFPLRPGIREADSNSEHPQAKDGCCRNISFVIFWIFLLREMTAIAVSLLIPGPGIHGASVILSAVMDRHRSLQII